MIMKLTALGKELRKIRLDCEEILFVMAKKLSMSSAMLSCIETGSKSAPDDFVEKLVRQYPTVASRRGEFEQLAELTKKSMKVDLDVSDEAKALAYEFRRELPNMSPTALRAIKELMTILQGNSDESKDKGTGM